MKNTTDTLALDKNYVDGAWRSNSASERIAHINPATENKQGAVCIAAIEDVNAAVAAATRAQSGFSRTSKQDRLKMFDRIIEVYQENYQTMAEAISLEMGAPISLAQGAQAGIGLVLLKGFRDSLSDFDFSQEVNGQTIFHQPIGVAALITPWNWPMNQIVAKVGAALAAGCCMVLKASEFSPYSAALFAKTLHQAGVDKGVFNLVQGDASTGAALAQHRDVSVVSITGSTRAGAAVAAMAAPTIKRVCQELGGKSAYIVMPDADLAAAASDCVNRICINSGQSCNAPSRLLVNRQNYNEMVGLLTESMQSKIVGFPDDPATEVGPVVNSVQHKKILQLIGRAQAQGAKLMCGTDSSISKFERGFFVAPTLLADVTAEMDIFREEVFGPVLCISVYDDIEQAVALANDSDYGLSAYIQAQDLQQAQEVALRLEVGMVHINGAAADPILPFGGWKMSGNGRERGAAGIEEYLESKVVFSS